MANQEVKFSNFYESTLATGGLPQNVTSCTLTAAPTTDGSSAIGANYYLVIDPDTAGSREVIEVTAAAGTSLTTVTRDIEGRYGTPGDASTAPNHNEGTVVRMAVVRQMFEDLHDRMDTAATNNSITTFTNKTFDANGTGNSISNIEVADLASGVLDTDLSSVAATDTTIPSAKAVKALVDTKASVGLVLALGG